jgi:hypothetical protein
MSISPKNTACSKRLRRLVSLSLKVCLRDQSSAEQLKIIIDDNLLFDIELDFSIRA